MILMAIVPEQDVAKLAGLYLKVLLLGAPGYATFEAGKRYVQAQGLFSASLYVLLICAPLKRIDELAICLGALHVYFSPISFYQPKTSTWRILFTP